MEKKQFDVAIVGAGVVGASIARELSRYCIRVCVVEKEMDLCEGTSKANSGIVHAGYDAAPGTLKAKLNVEGNQRMEELSKKLSFPFQRNGSLVLCFQEKDLPGLFMLQEQGEKNGVKGLRVVTGTEMEEIESNISKEAKAFLYAPSGGIVCPFQLTIAMAENAYANGVKFLLGTRVLDIEKEETGYVLTTSKGTISSRLVVNAAGVYGDWLHNRVSTQKIRIIPRKGEYCLLDKEAGAYVKKTIFQLPTELGKGILISPTVHGNLLVGPTAVDIEDKEALNTTREGLEKVLLTGAKSVKNLPAGQVITSFAGLRAHEEKRDFIIGEAQGAEGFYDAVGIDSPGLTSAPAIGLMAAGMIKERLHAVEKESFIEEREDMFRVAQADAAERNKRIRENPAYGNIICRCETVSEGEIMDAIRRPLGARTLDGVKRRTRAGMGRCQAGFCSPRVIQILARELGVSELKVQKAGEQSGLLMGRIKGDWLEDRV